MFRRAAQRPTEKTAGPRHPFFIRSRPEPVFCGGIFPSLFGEPQNCDPGSLTSKNIRGRSVGKPRLGVSRYCRVPGNRRTPREGRDSLLGGGRILQQAVLDPRSPPTLHLRGFRVPEAEAPGRTGGGSRRRAGCRWPDLPGGPCAALVLVRGARCQRGRHPHPAPPG